MPVTTRRCSAPMIFMIPRTPKTSLTHIGASLEYYLSHSTIFMVDFSITNDLGDSRLKFDWEFMNSSVSALGCIGRGVTTKLFLVEINMYKGQSKGEHSSLGWHDPSCLICSGTMLFTANSWTLPSTGFAIEGESEMMTYSNYYINYYQIIYNL